MFKRIFTIFILAVMLAGLWVSPAFAAEAELLQETVLEEVAAEPAADIPPADDGMPIDELPAIENGATKEQAAPKLPDAAQLKALLGDISAYQLKTVKNPTFAVAHGEWTVLSLARYGSITKAFSQKYLGNLYAVLAEKNGVLSTTQYTDYSRVVLALSALGEDPSNVAGYNLLLPLADFDRVARQGVNGASWALIAIDSRQYALPKSVFKNNTTRSKLIAHIVDSQLKDGGFSLLSGASSGDADLTGMALIALAPYSSQKNVETAIARALDFLSAKQFKNGGWGLCESTAQVITALNTLGIKMDDPRFIKDGSTPYDGLMRHYIEDGSFSHTVGSSANPIATDQAMYALISYYRAESGMSALFDMSGTSVKPDDDIAEVKNAIDALPQNPGIADKGDVALLIDRLEKLPQFSGKAAYAKKLADMKTAIEKTEASVKQLDADIWNRLNPRNITLADAETVAALLITYESLSNADRTYVKNALSLLDAKAIVDALAQGIIPAKVFQNLRNEDSYSYSGSGYSISFKGSDIALPADMDAGIDAEAPSLLPALKNAYWISFAQQGTLPASVSIAMNVGAADGAYTLYRFTSGRLEKLGGASVSGGMLHFTTAHGGDFVLVSSARPATLQLGKKSGKPEKLEKNMFEQIKGQNVNLLIEGQTDSGYAYRLTFNGENINKALPFDPQINTGGENAEHIGLLAEDAFIMDFAHEGALPGKMLVEIETHLPDGEYLLFLYEEREMRAQPGEMLTVKDGWASFFMEHCSDWFIAKRAKKASITELLEKQAAPAIVQVTESPAPTATPLPVYEAEPDSAPAPLPAPSADYTYLIILIAAAAAIIAALLLVHRKNRRVNKSEA